MPIEQCRRYGPALPIDLRNLAVRHQGHKGLAHGACPVCIGGRQNRRKSTEHNSSVGRPMGIVFWDKILDTLKAERYANRAQAGQSAASKLENSSGHGKKPSGSLTQDKTDYRISTHTIPSSRT